MLSLEFYQRSDVVQIAKDLIGTYLFTKIGDIITSEMIIETESYGGVTDRDSHAFNDRRTKRTETMYQRGGIAYVYLCYEVYPLIKARRKNKMPIAGGPGMLTQTLEDYLKTQ